MTAERRFPTPVFTVLSICAALVLAGCDDGSTEKAETAGQPAPSVIVVPVQSKPVSSASEYVGRSKASHKVEIRARVNGVLLKRPFREGGKVGAGDLLFSIDSAEFEAEKATAEAEVARVEAVLGETSANLARYKKLQASDVASVAKLDEAKAKQGQAVATLKAAKAALDRAELNLGYTKITSPIDGVSGIAGADVGNLIGPDTGVLVTVVNLDPIDVFFSIGEREYLDYRAARDSGNVEHLTPRIRLANDVTYAETGTFDMADNEVDPATGTLSLRVKFPNPNGLIVPGQFVNVILTSTKPEDRIVIPQAAIQENQSGPFVLLVDKDKRVEVRQIKTGERIGSEVVALDGLTVGEVIITEGIQKVRPGGIVNPTRQADGAGNS